MIYFIESGWLGPIKIGFTAGPVAARVRGLSTAHHRELTVLLTMEGDTVVERELHHRFADHRMRGEWFHPAPDLLSFICDAYIPPEARDEAPLPMVADGEEWRSEALRAILEMLIAVNTEDVDRFRRAHEIATKRIGEAAARSVLADKIKAMVDEQVAADEAKRQTARNRQPPAVDPGDDVPDR